MLETLLSYISLRLSSLFKISFPPCSSGWAISMIFLQYHSFPSHFHSITDPIKLVFYSFYCILQVWNFHFILFIFYFFEILYFPFVLKMFLNLGTTLFYSFFKSLWQIIPNLCHLVGIGCLFPYELRFSWFFESWIILDFILDILNIMLWGFGCWDPMENMDSLVFADNWSC